MKSFDGYLKKKLGNDYVLLAGGGHKGLSEFKIGDYLPLSGGIVTGEIKLNISDTYNTTYSSLTVWDGNPAINTRTNKF